MKLDSDGDSLWSKKYFYDYGTLFRNFIISNDNHLTISCDINYPAYSWTMKLISIDTTGEILWESIVIENDTSYNYSTFGLLQLPDSSFFMNGSYQYSDYNYKPFMARVSATGELLYTRVHELPWPEGSAMVNSICPDGNGNVMNCAVFTPNPVAMNGIWMIKTNPNGDTLWTKTITLEGTSYGPMSVTLCSDGGYTVAGNYYANFTPTSVESGAFIMRTDSLANPLWTRTYASDKNGFFYEIIEASDQGLAATGVASPSPGHQAFYLVKTDTAGLITSTWQPGAVADGLTVSPNPVADVCRVTLPHGCRQLNLLTLQGQTLLTINTTGKSTLELSTNWLPAGLYLLRAETNNFSLIEKLLKNR